MNVVLLLIYSSSVRRRFRDDHKPFKNTFCHDTSANCRRVFCFLNSKFPFMCHPRPRHVHISFKRKPRLIYKTISTEYLQWLKLNIQKFIFKQYSKFDLCDTGAMFYHQLSNEVNWKLIMVWVHRDPHMIKFSA